MASKGDQGERRECSKEILENATETELNVRLKTNLTNKCIYLTVTILNTHLQCYTRMRVGLTLKRSLTFNISLIAQALSMETKADEDIYVHCTNFVLQVGDCALCSLALKEKAG